MQDFLTFLLRPLLGEPDALHISAHPGSVTIKVSEADTGRVIGRHGHIINHLRVLLKTYCTLHNLPQVTLTLDAPLKTPTQD